MKLKKAGLLAFLLLPTLAVSQEVDTSALDAHQFSLGLIGFVGYVSEAEQRMNEIAAHPEANSIFLAIVDDPGRSNVARLYALCGLKKLRSPQFGHALDTLDNLAGKVSVMHGDIMEKEDVGNIVSQIKSHRCQ